MVLHLIVDTSLGHCSQSMHKYMYMYTVQRFLLNVAINCYLLML